MSERERDRKGEGGKERKKDSKMKKEKKSQVEIKNLRKKLQRSITQMMVLFGFLIKLHVK